MMPCSFINQKLKTSLDSSTMLYFIICTANSLFAIYLIQNAKEILCFSYFAKQN